MESIIKFITEKTGLNPVQAKSAAVAVVDFLKGKLPAPIVAQVENHLGMNQTTKGEEGGILEDVTSKVGDLFGKK